MWLTRLSRGTDGTWSGSGSLVELEPAIQALKEAEALVADSYCPDKLRTAARAAGLELIEPDFAPTACLHLTCIRHAAGTADDTMGLAPLYPREPEAVTLFNRRHRG